MANDSAADRPLPDGPLWPPDRWISPTALRNYDNCPRRVRLKYIDQAPEPPVFSLFLSKGRIAHNLLQYSARRISRGQPVDDDGSLLDKAIHRLPPEEFPSPEALRGHAMDILRWVRFGLDYLDRDAEYLAIERGNNRPLTVFPGLDPYKLIARPDLILLRTAPDGERYVEFIDYKTGKPRDDEMVPVFTRYVSREMLKRSLPDPTTARIQFTYLWLEPGEKQVVELTLEFCEPAWESATETIRSLASERIWPAQPSMLCHYCPYNGNACTAFQQMVNDTAPF
jgi:hypothetical protein